MIVGVPTRNLPIEENIKILKKIGFDGFQFDLSSCGIDTLKKDFLISVKDKPDIKVLLNILEEVIRPNCQFCPDFSNVYADISVGGIGAPKNNSVVVIRTETGENLFEDALSAGYIREYTGSEGIISDLNERTVKVIKKMTKIKGERAKRKRSTQIKR